MGIAIKYNNKIVGYRIYERNGAFNIWKFKTYWFLKEE